ncbi:hypothetical protein PMIN01_06954 [Paraphaeosphaeria minitans]|uniref:Uncharacterized protein n=1 Tax=Paraphaeosphaeria minitans TaxID=565426 RepID=A0A9P6KRF1_9PLEO|nr:hypothetical protein PMIN01_06954 [Paraphaeosphaeria minitans]
MIRNYVCTVRKSRRAQGQPRRFPRAHGGFHGYRYRPSRCLLYIRFWLCLTPDRTGAARNGIMPGMGIRFGLQLACTRDISNQHSTARISIKLGKCEER